MAVPQFVFFEDSWNRSNEPTTDEDNLEDGVYDYISTPKNNRVKED